jgi:outer membrane protein assembly factor BamA
LKRLTFRTLLYFLLLLTGLYSCSVKKFVPKGRYLVNNSKIIITDKTYPELKAGDLKVYAQPRHNKKVLFWRIQLWDYYQNQKKHTRFSEWRYKKFGEKPVYFYTEDAVRNARNMERYLDDIGFFHSRVSYAFHFNQKKKLADITYTVTPSKPYHIDTVMFVTKDSTLIPYVKKYEPGSLLKVGDIYNAYTMDDERDRLTALLRNDGYYYFNRSYIQFVADTNFGKHAVSIREVVLPRAIMDDEHPGKVHHFPHIRYFIDTVNIIPDYDPLNKHRYTRLDHVIKFRRDTTHYHYNYFCRRPQRFSLITFDNAIDIKPGMVYSDKAVKQTYSNLFNFKILSSSDITFEPLQKPSADSGSIGSLNARIQMQTGKLNSISFETVGTNSSGDLGVNGIVSFANRNLFKRAEVFNLRVYGGFEAQHIGRLPADSSITSKSRNGLLNTFEAGVEASITFPMALFPFRKLRVSGMAQTRIGVGYSSKIRPYYSQNVSNVEFSYSWKQGKYLKHLLTPLNLNFVKVNPTPAFRNILDRETHQQLKEQYSDHMIAGLRYSVVFNNQQLHHAGNFNYLRLDMETSGNLIRQMNNFFGGTTDSLGNYTFFGVPYSQYFRYSIDYRHYIQFDNQGKALVFRGLVGMAIPYGNSSVIPFEKSFFAGGANGMRAWRFRTLGPGSFSGSDDYERVGDMQIEANIEYRFPVIGFFKGALFVDAGNIWNFNKTTVFPGGEFAWHTFAKEIAIDAGLGVRLDFSFFIFRLDFAVPLQDPSYPLGQRWRMNVLQWKNVAVNFGIGYPF